jgi:hypothetical protein
MTRCLGGAAPAWGTPRSTGCGERPRRRRGAAYGGRLYSCTATAAACGLIIAINVAGAVPGAAAQGSANCTHSDFVTLQNCEHPIAHPEEDAPTTGQSPADCLRNVSAACAFCMRHAGTDNHPTSSCFLDNQTVTVDACTTMELVSVEESWTCKTVENGKCDGVLSGKCGACLVAAGVTMNSCDFFYKKCKPWDGECERVDDCVKVGDGCGGVWSTNRGRDNIFPEGSGTPSPAMQCSRCAVGLLPKESGAARSSRLVSAGVPLLAVATAWWAVIRP